MKIGKFKIPPLYFLLIFVPIAIVLELMHASPVWIFVISCIAIVPLAGLMGESTEHLAHHVGPGLGGLLNATFGNAAEVILALLALHAGLIEVVKASITGSIIGNSLLVLGLAVLAGGIRKRNQRFNATAALLGTSLLALSAVALLMPAVFHAVVPNPKPATERHLTDAICVVLMLVYVLALVFQLVTHKYLFSGDPDPYSHEPHNPKSSTADPDQKDGAQVLAEELHHGPVWSKKKAFIMLIVSTVFVALIAEFLIGSVHHTAEVWGMNQVFVGVILLAIIGNAAEHSTAVIMAAKNKMDLAINIAVGSSVQIALFVAPLLVFAGHIMGQPMDLIFTPFEVVAVIFTVGVLTLVLLDGKSHWMEGILLLAVYVILGIAFFFMPVEEKPQTKDASQLTSPGAVQTTPTE